MKLLKRIIPIVIIAVGIACIIIGIKRAEVDMIFITAIMVCLGCIGIG